MAAPGVIEFKNRSGQVVGRVGPTFYAPLDFGMMLYRNSLWRGLVLVQGIAIARVESWFSPNAEGDLLRVGEPTDDGRHWDKSVQVFQQRTIKEDYGKGTVRDEKKLCSSTTFAIRAAYTIWEERERLKGKGKGWTHWGAFNSGAYEQFMTKAQKVVDTLGVM